MPEYTQGAGTTPSFLPDFCSAANLLRTMIMAQLLVFVLVAVRPGELMERMHALALITLFVHWIAIVDVALLCALRGWLARRDDRLAAALAFTLLQAVALLFTVVAHGLAASGGFPFLDRSLGVVLLENGLISAIICAVGLRYFYVTAEWQRNVEAEAQARVQALQARIRPHFLFNSMNTIASLTRSDPVAAEQAVEDLAALFRVTLAQRPLLRLAEELDFVASYLRIEALRLGERLAVEWDLDPAAAEARLPALSLQPLVENAVYHGIERRPDGGTVRIITRRRPGGRVGIEIENPLPVRGHRSGGHQVAQENVRQRLELAWQDGVRFEVDADREQYRVLIEIPAGEEG